MNDHSIQSRILSRSVLAIGLVLALALFLAQFFIVNWLKDEFDARLLDKANLLTTLTKEMDSGIEFDFADEFMPEFESETDPQYFQIWLHSEEQLIEGDGGNFERSRTLKDSNLPRKSTNVEGITFDNLILPDGSNGRLVQRTFIPQIPENRDRTFERYAAQDLVTLVVAMHTKPLMDLIAAVRSYLALGAICLTLVISLILYKMTASGFSPVKDIHNQLSKIKSGEYDKRLHLTNTPEELDLIIQQINNLLERVEVSIKREKLFSANAAHELKTPISELVTMTEIEQKWPGGEVIEKKYLEDVLTICREMSKKVTSLLLLSHADSENYILHPEEIDLSQWLPELISRTLNNANNQTKVNYSLPSTATIHVSVNEFQIIISNIFSNAIDYNIDNHPIEVTVNYESPESYSVKIVNKTDNLETKDLDVMFDRLWRKDTARNSGKNSGLGLSLVKSYSALLGLSITTSLDKNQIFSITLTY